MTRKQRKRTQLMRMFRRQDGRCHWCATEMIPPHSFQPKHYQRPPLTLCTFDHLDDRFSEERGKHGGEFRNVAACWKCNNDRAKAREASLPREILWQKSGSPP